MARYDDDDDDDDRPSRRRRSRDDDDDYDDDDDDRPSRRKNRRRKRSTGQSGGVTLVGVLTMIIGGLQVLWGCGCGVGAILFFSMGAAVGQAANRNAPQQGFGNVFAAFGAAAGAIMLVITLVIFAIAALHLWSGYNVIQRKSWARILVLVLAGLHGANALLWMFWQFYSLLLVQMQFRTTFSAAIPHIGGSVLEIGFALTCFIILLQRDAADEFQ